MAIITVRVAGPKWEELAASHTRYTHGCNGHKQCITCGASAATIPAANIGRTLLQRSCARTPRRVHADAGVRKVSVRVYAKSRCS